MQDREWGHQIILHHCNEKLLKTLTKSSAASITVVHLGRNLNISSNTGTLPPFFSLPPVPVIPVVYSEYSQLSFLLNRGPALTPLGPNMTSVSNFLSHILLHKKRVVIPSGGISYPSCWVLSHQSPLKAKPCNHKSVGWGISCNLVHLFHGHGLSLVKFCHRPIWCCR